MARHGRGDAEDQGHRRREGSGGVAARQRGRAAGGRRVLVALPSAGAEHIGRAASLSLHFTDGVAQEQLDTDLDGDFDADDRAAGSALAIEDAGSGEPIDGALVFTAALDLDDADPLVAGADLALAFTPCARLDYSQLVQVSIDGALESDRATRITNLEAQSRVRGTLGEDREFGDEVRSEPFASTLRVVDPPPLQLVASAPADGALFVSREDGDGNARGVVLQFSEGLRQDSAVLGETVFVEDVTGLDDPYDAATPGGAIAGTLAFDVAEGTYDVDGKGGRSPLGAGDESGRLPRDRLRAPLLRQPDPHRRRDVARERW